MAVSVSEAPALISETTVWSLFATVVILAAGYLSSRLLLPTSASNKTRFLFIWHATDALIHFVLEGGYLWQCFFSSSSLAEAGVEGSEYLPQNVFFLGDRENVYGASYGTSPMSALWREYARADKRWGGSDITVISLELLTVFVAGPLAVWICYCIKRNRSDASFWMVVLATGELYGGWMTFVPVRQTSCAVRVENLLTLMLGMVMRKSEPRHFQLDVHVAVSVFLQHDLGVGSSVDSVRLLPDDYPRCGRTEPAERREEALLIGIAGVQLARRLRIDEGHEDTLHDYTVWTQP